MPGLLGGIIHFLVSSTFSSFFLTAFRYSPTNYFEYYLMNFIPTASVAGPLVTTISAKNRIPLQHIARLYLSILLIILAYRLFLMIVYSKSFLGYQNNCRSCHSYYFLQLQGKYHRSTVNIHK